MGAYDLLQEVHGCRVRRIDVERDLERRHYRRVAAMAVDSYSSAQCEHSSPTSSDMRAIGRMRANAMIQRGEVAQDLLAHRDVGQKHKLLHLRFDREVLVGSGREGG